MLAPVRPNPTFMLPPAASYAGGHRDPWYGTMTVTAKDKGLGFVSIGGRRGLARASLNRVHLLATYYGTLSAHIQHTE